MQALSSDCGVSFPTSTVHNVSSVYLKQRPNVLIIIYTLLDDICADLKVKVLLVSIKIDILKLNQLVFFWSIFSEIKREFEVSLMIFFKNPAGRF